MVEIAFEASLSPQSEAAINVALGKFNRSQVPGYPAPVTIGFVLKDPDTGSVDGGLTGRISFNQLFVELLVVPERLRGQGVGRELMGRAEKLARERGCAGIWLDTFTFQAPGFYKKLGFTEFGAIADYPPGHSRVFLHKHLS
ncbi:GCN5 family acetyltransferase [Devosia epidermidihirudinis]|uniref:GCN5 family acetyltransferase n=1 Tax=Devosia epidermidihirudinis TaxID=1293439 RepID=A0A0F5Q2L3_9HYPH|nr:GNAT family N-acetyltransferase [Devosia epidermidihirudinis]KKC35100.1 GCN5 family acetyltransferase [Devosia epidermidihirudinis]